MVALGLAAAAGVAALVFVVRANEEATSTADAQTLDVQSTRNLEAQLSSGNPDEVFAAIAPETWDALGAPPDDLAMARSVALDQTTAIELGDTLFTMQGTVDGVAATFLVRLNSDGTLQLLATSEV